MPNPEHTPKIINARQARQKQTIVIELGPDRAVRARRMDMAAMLFEGVMPMPLLSAAQKLTSNPDDNRTNVEKFNELTEKAELVSMLRKHASLVVMEPHVVEVDDGNPDHMPAELFSFMELIEIWKATAIIPKVVPAEAESFRGGAAPDAPAPLRDVNEVREATVVVDRADEYDEELHV